MGSDAINSPTSGRAVYFHMSGKLAQLRQLLDDRMEQYDSLFPEAQRRINTGEEGAAAVLSGGCLNI